MGGEMLARYVLGLGTPIYVENDKFEYIFHQISILNVSVMKFL
jgi:hypothetical protein